MATHDSHYVESRGTQLYFSFFDTKAQKFKMYEIFCITDTFTLGADSDNTTNISCISGHTTTIAGNTQYGEVSLTLACDNTDGNQALLNQLYIQRPKPLVSFMVCDGEGVGDPKLNQDTGVITPPADRTSSFFKGSIIGFERSYTIDSIVNLNCTIARQTVVTTTYYNLKNPKQIGG